MRCPTCHRRLAPSAPCPLHGACAPALEETRAASWPGLPGFEILSCLGGGGFAQVFAARAAADARVLALKVAHGAGDDRFRREADALLRLGPPTTPKLHAEGRTAAGHPYLLMDLIDGASLASWMGRQPGGGAAPLDPALSHFSAVCRAVQQAHSAGIVHRDLKPENIFLKEGSATLIDFGLARFAEDPSSGAGAMHLTRTGQRLGTAHYMAPEQCLESGDVGPPADVYSLGVLLFELLSGRPPFNGDYAEVIQAHVSHRPPSLAAIAPVPLGLEAIVLRCLAKNPAARFANAGELLESLERWRGAASSAPDEVLSAPRTSANVAGSSHLLRRQRVVLLGVGTSTPVDRLVELAAAEKGRLAWIERGRYLFAFAESGSPDAQVRAARRAAGRMSTLLGDADRLILHVADARIRTKGGLVQISAPALEGSSLWWPIALEPGRWTTAEAAALLEGDSSLAAGPPKRWEVPATGFEAPATVALQGRDGLLAQLREDRRSVRSHGMPTITTLLGEPGCGKTRLLQTLFAELVGSEEFQVFSLDGKKESRVVDPALRSLLQQAFCLAPPPWNPEEIQAACKKSLDPAIAESTWSAVAAALGALDEKDERTASLFALAGAARHAVAKAAGAAIRASARKKPVALLVDDLQWVDPTTLDALEIATLGGEPAAVWVCAFGGPELLQLRPFWADRAGGHYLRELTPLDEASSRALLLELIAPVEFIPEALLSKLIDVSHGVPLALIELVGAMHAEGAFRQNPEGNAWYIAGDELLGGPAPVYERLARRALQGLAAPIRSLAYLCAAVGSEVSVEDLEAAQQWIAAGERLDWPSQTFVDAGIGLERLSAAGLMRRSASGEYAFRHPQLAEAVEKLIPAALRRSIHRTLLDGLKASYADGASTAQLRRIARHAEAAESPQDAVAANLKLAERCRHEHRYVEAERHYSLALQQSSEHQPEERCTALAGRGKVRYRVQRFTESLQDLRAARELAEQTDRAPQIADLLLEEATVLDWLEDWAASRQRVEAALPLVRAAAEPHLMLKASLAQGRTHNRRDEYQQAIEVLEPLVEKAVAMGEPETAAIAQVLLGFALAHLDLERSEACFERAIAFCKRTGDDFHLGIAYSNRVMLWIRRGSADLAAADLRLALLKARELGYPQIERFASFNLAECLYWQDRVQEALPFARRAHDLGLRFFSDRATALDALLVARIACALGQYEEARQQVEWIERHSSRENFSAGANALYQSTRLLAHHGIESPLHLTEVEWNAWKSLAASAPLSVPGEEWAEVLGAAGRVAAAAGHETEARAWACQASPRRQS